MVQDSDELTRFYEDSYTSPPAEAERNSRWRALGAAGKADHVLELCRRAALAPGTVLDVGCGDGALLSELRDRGFGERLAGVEITPAALTLAAQRAEIDAVELYDGRRLPFADRSFQLGILSHVLEHVHEPAALLAETARVCEAVVCEVPLERNWSARRPSRRARARAVGHLQRLDRDAARALVAAAGLELLAELEDSLPLTVHTFFARDAPARAAGAARWALRAGLHRALPPVARRLFTVHYACLVVRPGARASAAG